MEVKKCKNNHEWINNNNFYTCIECGLVTKDKPIDFYEIESEQPDSTEETEHEKCRHVWECLRDRCHNRGKGKYQAYKCKLCGKFQRR